jgi:hypothetical protein
MAYVPPFKRAGTDAGGSSTPFAAAAMRRFAALEEPPAPSRFDALGPSKPRSIATPEPHAPFQEPLPSPPVEVEEESVAGGSALDWLKKAQKGYVAKTPEQIRQECLSMNYDQLKIRAGPPPSVSSDDYGGVWEQGGEGEGGRTCILFDENLRLYKQGRCPPPVPLFFGGHDEPIVDAALAMDGVVKVLSKSPSAIKREAYASWYEQWGKRLRFLWEKDHTVHTTKKPVQKRVEEEKPKGPSRFLVEEVSPHSGW